MQGQLTEEQVREVLARAEEIHLSAGESDVQSVLRAAEEAGLPREAVEQALRERLALPTEPPKTGGLSFAKSADGKYYVAEVLEASSQTCRVRFLKGGEHQVAASDILPLAFMPGRRVVCPWPEWGWWTCTVISYDAGKQKIKVSDGWGTERKFSIDEVRLDPPRTVGSTPMGDVKNWLGAHAAGMASGGLIGAAITWLLMR